TVAQAAGHSVNELTHGYGTELDFKVPWTHHISAYTNDPGAGIVRPAELGVVRASHGNNVLHVAQSLDVVDDCRRHVEPEHSREVGRLNPGIGPLPFERFDQPGFFAADISASSAVNEHFDIETGTKDILAE